MQKPSLRLSLLSLVLAAAAAPALAGNYAEGDPRPAQHNSTLSRAAVAAEAQAWAQTAPTGGYPEGNPRAVAQVQENTRAAVQADTRNWIRSGLAALQGGDVSIDTKHPAYQRALNTYARLQAEDGVRQAAAQSPTGNAHALH